MKLHPLTSLGTALARSGYRFTAITPLSHASVNARAQNALARDVRDVFGWSRPFSQHLLPAPWLDWLEEAGALSRIGNNLQSRIRYATLDDGIYAHSAFPTDGEDAVFFGPDTYRFVRFVKRHALARGRVVDVGCGSGAGGLSVLRHVSQLVLGDVNPYALELARVNAALAGSDGVQVVQSDVLTGTDGLFDTVLANPPYLVDDRARTYRHGGDDLGTALGVRIAREAISRLAPGGRLLLYTGAPVVRGRDVFHERVIAMFADAGFDLSYEEIDPDVFGEELRGAAYAEVERIAAVGLVATRTG